MSPEALESIIHELWHFKAWEMQAFDKIEWVKHCAWLSNFNLTYSWYSLLENFGSETSNLEMLAALLG